MTIKQINQFNQMLASLTKICKAYQTTNWIRKNCQNQYGLDFEESLEMSYENIQAEAKEAIKKVKPLIPQIISFDDWYKRFTLRIQKDGYFNTEEPENDEDKFGGGGNPFGNIPE